MLKNPLFDDISQKSFGSLQPKIKICYSITVICVWIIVMHLSLEQTLVAIVVVITTSQSYKPLINLNYSFHKPILSIIFLFNERKNKPVRDSIFIDHQLRIITI